MIGSMNLQIKKTKQTVSARAIKMLPVCKVNARSISGLKIQFPWWKRCQNNIHLKGSYLDNRESKEFFFLLEGYRSLAWECSFVIYNQEFYKEALEKIIFWKWSSALVTSAVETGSYLGEAPKPCNKLRPRQ